MHHPSLLLPDPGNNWVQVRDGHPLAIALYQRHYSCRPLENRKLAVGPGGKMVLLAADATALFVWRDFINDDGQQGINCAVFRNEGPRRSSDLLLEAEAFARARWPGRRFYTYVNANALHGKATNPGCCFKKAGWRRCGTTKKRGLLILEKS